jgi:hypothetical protein
MTYMFGFETPYHIEKFLNKLPLTLEKLTFRHTYLNLDILPMFPNLTTLEIYLGNSTPSTHFQTRCPALTTLILTQSFFSLECLRGVKLQRLVIRSVSVVDVSPLVDAYVDELDLTECPHVTGLSKFPNVKTIKQ